MVKKEESKKEVKKITAGLVFSWIFGLLFLLAGVGSIATNPILGIVVILLAVIIIPYTNSLLAEKFNFEVSGGLKFVAAILILVCFGFMGADLAEETVSTGNYGSTSVGASDSDVVAGSTGSKSLVAETPKVEIPKQKVKRATLSIDRVQIQVANLYPTRVTVSNTGDVSIRPKFDIYVYDSDNNEVCSGSPLFDEITSISAGQKQTGELSIIGCIFSEDGDYLLRVDLLDDQYNKLDSATKEFSVNYWNQFNFG